jgi:hypothetical protein
MTQIILLLAFPIGLYIYFWDKRNVQEAENIFNTFIEQTKQDTSLSKSEKIERIAKMFVEINGYKLIERKEGSLIVSDKHINIGVVIMLFGVFNYFGILAVLVYYYYFLKPMQYKITID